VKGRYSLMGRVRRWAVILNPQKTITLFSVFTMC
jgi:hypothetical protein